MALDGIYLGPVQDNDQGGSIIMDLSAGREITRSDRTCHQTSRKDGR